MSKNGYTGQMRGIDDRFEIFQGQSKINFDSCTTIFHMLENGSLGMGFILNQDRLLFVHPRKPVQMGSGEKYSRHRALCKIQRLIKSEGMSRISEGCCPVL